MKDGYRPGDFYRQCDRTGFKVRASQTRQEWTGAIVREQSWEARHPQDFVRGRRDKQSVPDPRPRSTDVLIGPLTTELSAAAAAGATTINVLSTARFEVGDTLGIALNSGDMFRVQVQTVTSATALLLLDPLTGAVSSGNAVVNYSAVSAADIT